MATPSDVANVMWFTQPFLFTSLCFTVHACVKTLTPHRCFLVISCALGIVSNGILIATFSGFQNVDFSTLYLVGVTAYNCSLWSARLYVCMRMAKLSPSPTMAKSFNHLAYVVAALFILTMVTFITSAVDFYQTHSFEIPATTNVTAFSANLVANLIFEFTSIYLHVKSLRMFATSNATGIKLYIISISTLASIFFGLVQIGFHVTKDVLTELIFSGLQAAVLPSSVVLGEAIAVRYGACWGKPLQSVSVGSHAKLAASATIKSKALTASGSLAGKEDPIRQSATSIFPRSSGTDSR